ncbi:methylated-DNA--[protein]-cysteine S-methyltransferase [Antribacter sp. KLBMP9083]|uniref:Methylated-DNA--[protein]-cysteine S-methyltransferase n=1 Tax=Antribacter soli TaxID=2910976 RepID=A0AA41QBZ6_9MICO|nr:methylated-DNA--[protein]-cysteine S-methyltransferase [Antribacter soli]MCF4120655.1 methylated-DNA--[protein]-cysteine S-methyltransferase [Antribacter soli]
MTALTTTLTTPDGPFSVVVDDESVLAAGWTADVASLVALIHPTLRPAEVQVPGEAAAPSGSLATAMLSDAAKAVEAYYAGDLAAPGRVPVRQASGPYRTHAWDVLRTVEPGERITYSEYAERTGRPAAVRAAAGACAMNAAALFVPCHRILRTDGTLGGFRYGLPVKESLLARELT